MRSRHAHGQGKCSCTLYRCSCCWTYCACNMIASLVTYNQRQWAASSRLLTGTWLNLPYVPGLKTATYLSLFLKKKTDNRTPSAKTNFISHVIACYTFRPLLIACFILSFEYCVGARGGAVGWGTALLAGRSRVRFPMVSLEFFIDIFPTDGPGVYSVANSHEYHRYFMGR